MDFETKKAFNALQIYILRECILARPNSLYTGKLTITGDSLFLNELKLLRTYYRKSNNDIWPIILKSLENIIINNLFVGIIIIPLNEHNSILHSKIISSDSIKLYKNIDPSTTFIKKIQKHIIVQSLIEFILYSNYYINSADAIWKTFSSNFNAHGDVLRFLRNMCKEIFKILTLYDIIDLNNKYKSDYLYYLINTRNTKDDKFITFNPTFVEKKIITCNS